MVNYNLTYTELWSKIKRILAPEVSFYLVSISYGVAIGIFTLAVPVSVQSFVNNVTFGTLLQPLIIICFVLLLILTFSGVLNALQSYSIEIFQRHFFARNTAEMTLQIINSSSEEFNKNNGVELYNRYFDLMTVQKSMASLLTDFTAIILQTIVGLMLVAFYHPYFLIVDIILIVLLVLVWKLFGRHALISAIDESKAKYKLANWLQEVARVNLNFRNKIGSNFASQRADEKISYFLKKRKSHFRSLFYQIILLLMIYGFISALVLGVGGYLVVKGELTVGQLVASELIITGILASLAKSGKYLESFYDLIAAVDKLNQLFDIKTEVQQEIMLDSNNQSLSFNDVKIKTSKYLYDFNFQFEFGKNYFISSNVTSVRGMFLQLLSKTFTDYEGQILFSNSDLKDLNQSQLRDSVSILDGISLFNGTIYENLTLGGDYSTTEINKVLELVDLNDLTILFSDGLQTILLPNGNPLWHSQKIRLELAKIILQKPKYIILGEIFNSIEIERRMKVINYLKGLNCTLILLGDDQCVNFDLEVIQFKRRNL